MAPLYQASPSRPTAKSSSGHPLGHSISKSPRKVKQNKIVETRAIALTGAPDALNTHHDSPSSSFSKTVEVPRKTAYHRKRKHDEADVSKDNETQHSPSKKAKHKHPSYNVTSFQGVSSIDLSSPESNNDVPPPPASSQVLAHTPQPRQIIKNPSRSPKSARVDRRSMHRSGSKTNSAAAAFEAIHIPERRLLNPAAIVRQDIAEWSLHQPTRQQPVREVKTLRSIEPQDDPSELEKVPLGWDEPKVYDGRYLRQCAIDNIFNGNEPFIYFPPELLKCAKGIALGGSPARERDESFVPSNSAPVSDAETAPSEIGRRSRKRREESYCDGQTESSTAAESREDRTQIRGRSSSFGSVFKRGLAAVFDLASTRIDASQVPGVDDEVVQISESSFHLAQNRKLDGKVAYLTQLVHQHNELTAATRRDCNTKIEGLEAAVDRLSQSRPAGPQCLPGPMQDNQGDRTPVMAHLPDSAEVNEASVFYHTSSKYPDGPSIPAIQGSGSSEQPATNKPAGPAPPQTPPNPGVRSREEPSSRERSAKGSERRRKQDSDRLQTRAGPAHGRPSFSISKTPASSKFKRARSTGPTSAKSWRSNPSSSRARRRAWTKRIERRSRAFSSPLNTDAYPSSVCKHAGQANIGHGKAFPDSSKTDAKETVTVHAIGRAPDFQHGTEAALEERTRQERQTKKVKKAKKPSSTPKRDKGKEKAIHYDHDLATNDAERLVQEAGDETTNKWDEGKKCHLLDAPACTEPLKKTAHGSSAERNSLGRRSSALPDLETIFRQYGIPSNRQPAQEASTAASNGQSPTAGEIPASKYPGRHFTNHKRPQQTVSTTDNSPQADGYGHEPAPKRPQFGTPAPPKDQLALSYVNGAQSGNQVSVHQRRGEKGSSKTSSSLGDPEPAQQNKAATARPVLSAPNNDRVASRNARHATKSEVHGKREVNASDLQGGRQKQCVMGQSQRLPRRHPLTTNSSFREVSMPLSTIQQWDQPCRCLNLPEYFDGHGRLSLKTWPASKEQLLAHCWQIMECHAHPDWTRRSCRDLFNMELPKFQEELRRSGQGGGPWQEARVAYEVSPTAEMDIGEAIASAIMFLSEPTEESSHLQQSDQPHSRDHGIIPSNLFYGKDALRPQSRQLESRPPFEAVDGDDKLDAAELSTIDTKPSIEMSPSSADALKRLKTWLPPGPLGSPTCAFQPPPGLPTPPCSSSPTHVQTYLSSKERDAGENRSLSAACASSPNSRPCTVRSSHKRRKAPAVILSPFATGAMQKEASLSSPAAPHFSPRPDPCSHRTAESPRYELQGSLVQRDSPEQPFGIHREQGHWSASICSVNLKEKEASPNRSQHWQLPDLDDEEDATNVLPSPDHRRASSPTVQGSNTCAIPNNGIQLSAHRTPAVVGFNHVDVASGSVETDAPSRQPGAGSRRKKSRRTKTPTTISAASASANSEARQQTAPSIADNPSPDTDDQSQDHPSPTIEPTMSPDRLARSIFRRHETEPIRSPRLTSPATAVRRRLAPHGKNSFYPRDERLSNLQAGSPFQAVAEHTISSTHAPDPSTAIGGQDTKSHATLEPKAPRPKLSKDVPHAERKPDEELVRIGRYKTPRIRYESAPYAFRECGKLYAEYRYLLGRKDIYGETWDEALKTSLTSKN